jgi:hypothetical protein
MRALGVMLVLGLAGCGGCGDPPKTTRGGGPVTVETLTPPGDVPQPKAIYREAFEEAKKEITLDNAEDQLEEIERQVAEGR